MHAPADHALLASLPKAELHLHIEGTLTPARMLALAERNGVTLPYADEDAIRAAYAFENLQSFLDLYYQGMGVLRTEADFYDLTMDYLRVCRRETILHAELGFDPQGHTERGIAFEVALGGIRGAMEDAHREWGQSSLLIMNFLRHLPPESAAATLEQAKAHAAAIAAVGLDSSEVGYPPEPFAEVFAAAGTLGWRRVAHAGEEGPPEYIWGAINALQVDRIDHGVRAEEDEALMTQLVATQLPLTVCPQSNVRLCAVPQMAEHNILRLLRRGVRVTVNSDDPSYFGGYLTDNYVALAEHLDPTLDEMVTLARHSFTASFLSPEEQVPMLDALAEWQRANVPDRERA